MTMCCDEIIEVDESFAELLDQESTEVTARFVAPCDDELEFDLRTPSRWSELPRLAPAADVVVGVEVRLVVHDAAAAIAFYARAFAGVERARDALPDGRIVAAAVAIGACVIHLCDDFPELRGGRPGSPRALGGSPVTLDLAVDGIERLFARAVRAGAVARIGLHDTASGLRQAVLEDPFGHLWSLRSAHGD